MSVPPAAPRRAWLPALAVTVAGLWLPFLWCVFSDQRGWLLERAWLLPGLLPAASLGQKTSDRLVATAITAAVVVLLTALGSRGPRARRLAGGLALAAGAACSFSLYQASKM